MEDDHNGIPIILHAALRHRRPQVIQGEGERPSTMRPMRTKAREILIDALR